MTAPAVLDEIAVSLLEAMLAEPTAPVRHRRSLPRPPVPVATAAVLSVLLGTVFLAMPVSGTDLAAAVAHGDFARQHPLTPVDMRWYGGTNQFGYSLISQYFIAVLGARLAGALAAACASLAFADLLRRTAAARPTAGAAVGTVFVFGSLVSGRIAYGIGVAFAVTGLLLLTHGRRGPAAWASAFAAAASPVAGLFLLVAAAARATAGRRGAADGLAVGAAASVPLAVTGLLFGQGGWNHINSQQTRPALVLAAAVVLLVPHRQAKAGAALSALLVVAAAHAHTPVGMNACRLAFMFAVPVVVATVRAPAAAAVAIAIGLIHYQPPLALGDFRHRGEPATTAAYYQPLIDELTARRPTARVEIPPLLDYWDSVYVARRFPLARGWLRQADTRRNGLFFYGTLDPDDYRRWLADHAVQYVAVAAARPSWVGAQEVALVRGGQPYLRRVWSSADWTLYATDPVPQLATRPARVVALDSTGVVVDAPGRANVLLRVQYSRWLTVSPGSACLQRDGEWTRLVTESSGRYRVSSRLQPRAAACRNGAERPVDGWATPRP